MGLRYAAPLALSAMLGGCAMMVEEVARTQDSRILNPDGVQGDRRRFARPAAAADRQTAAPGSTSSAGNPLMEEATGRLRGDRRCLEGGAGADFTFFCRQKTSESDTGNTAYARNYLASGITLSNELCDAWFSRLQVAQVTLRQSSDMISSLGSVTAAIMGFTDTPAKTIGLTASLFGAGKQANDNLAANYIVAVDLTSVASAVREYRALYAQQIDQSQASWNYYTARRVVMAYDNTCSAIFVRRFVNARVEGGASDSEEVEPLLEAAIAAFLAESSEYFAKALTPTQLIDLYAFLYMPDMPKPARAEIAKGLKAEGLLNADESVAFKQNDGKPLATPQSLSRLLINTNIDAAIKTRARARVEAIRAMLAAEADSKLKDAGEAKTKLEEAVRAQGVLSSRVSVTETAARKAEAESAAAKAKVDALTPEEIAANTPETQKLITDAGALRDEATRKRQEANTAREDLNGAVAIFDKANTESLQAAQAAETAQVAATGAKAVASQDAIEAERATAPVPTGPNGRPLDAAPKP